MNIDQCSASELGELLTTAEAQYAALQKKGLTLDLTRGKPSAEQTALSDALDGILNDNYKTEDGTDTRNYGGLAGIAQARQLFGEVLGTPPEETFVGGNASLTMMYDTVDFALTVGLRGPESAWGNEASVKFVCPAPGYDRHFAICEHLGIEMITVPMLSTGPDMDAVETLVANDSAIKGMWCVPRFANPTGCVYDNATVERIAKLGRTAAEHFLVLWDNAYAVHTIADNAPRLAPIRAYCAAHGTLDSVFQFGSTSKVTFAGAGVAFMASSEANLAALEKHLAIRTIGPDKVNQLRHVRLLPDIAAVNAHMEKHAQLIRPRFETVLKTLEAELAGSGMGQWLAPSGGYFISFDTRPGLAKEVVSLAADIGVKLTPAGATFPYGNDPDNCNIRLAPTFPSLEEVQAAADAFVVCVKLASVRSKMAGK
ncbi:MAG: aminotransferase class I/II-fold pyridoxal phosphate-dependent enzyme [Halioglobus sp.]